MSLSDDQMHILHIEVAHSKSAKQAYDLFIKDHVDVTVKQLYMAIDNCSVSDIDSLRNLKFALSAIRGLESSVLNIIESGKLAILTLEQENAN